MQNNDETNLLIWEEVATWNVDFSFTSIALQGDHLHQASLVSHNRIYLQFFTDKGRNHF